MNRSICLLLTLALFATVAFGQALPKPSGEHNGMLEQIYRDESHCLTGPEIRNEKDNPISCYCRDAIMDARYVYFTYLLPGKDENLNGTFLALQGHVQQMCSSDSDTGAATMLEQWKWRGPEVVRTYPADEVVERISPEMKDEKPVGRWVPFTVQLVYRDEQGRVTRTENYASREFDPVFPKAK